MNGSVRWSVVSGCLLCLCAVAQDTNRPPPPRPEPVPSSVAISSTHRFIAAGMTSAENVSLAASAEEVAGKTEEAVGVRLPSSRGQPLMLSARHTDQAARGHVIKAQGWVDGRLTQKLIITNPEKVDQEDVLEGLTWLLLNRYVISRQTPGERTARLGTVPDWLSTGLAQNLYLALRARNSRVVVRRWQQGDELPMAEILDLEYLPEGRWSEKAFSGLAFDWLTSLPRAPALFEGMFGRLARGEKITAEWLTETVTGQNVDLGELEKGWDLWIAQQTQVKRYWGDVSDEKLVALRELSKVRPEELGILEKTGVPSSMTLTDLIDYREAPWMAMLAARLGLKVKSLAIGESPDFRQVIDRYGAFLDALQQEASRTAFGRALWRSRARSRLVRSLDLAQNGLADFEKSLAERRKYVGDAERAAGQEAGAGSSSHSVEEMKRLIPRSEMRRYVDEADRSAGTE